MGNSYKLLGGIIWITSLDAVHMTHVPSFQSPKDSHKTFYKKHYLVEATAVFNKVF